MPPDSLVHANDSLPGITRRAMKRGWAYFDASGARITDREEIDRLNAIAMPPAYRDCWFCPHPHGHIQATGYDDRGRKQYRYHLDFRAAREAEKYAGCPAFGRALPRLRARIEADLSRRGLRKEKTLAAVVRLLDLAKVRVGNEQYAAANKSFGATTLRRRHVDLRGQALRLRYRAKSGREHELTVTDRRLVRFVRAVQDLPGQHLFQYLDEEGVARPITSGDVNAYIAEAMGGDFTAKHFRTWGASVIAFETLAAGSVSLKQMIEPVAAALGNTPAISRKSYIHPALIELCRNGQDAWRQGLRLPRATRYLSRYERGLIAFLEEAGGSTALPLAA
ncbi:MULTISPECIES: DNA topoisomerase IB [Sphingobium]|uniref:DNA topoisomerase n=1 Tax=Sphingobium fuliginis ATCC 27551 TaxID=1208342 RepID=A0A5B8CKZ8_SPHSA|nr:MULTISPECIES: DNA topoisomerase IB [Sphingobium]OAP31875.1 DNA topoisomerase [Sphingobium sp. 20006FA]KXU32352.1 DNA topoisomerase [Sphingobium sp. AM]KYC32245.1 DNA topoisomerase [Sphingobium sp. 22B]QDC38897.1 DNA topoisomerase IB [Sphingobium fuliginis ATCC 27551]UXC90810.1 DNA topoisomerase IB [Sphingobium sp. RSMS]